ncbi:fasciculation and elongation protein zeta-2 [Neocloeon triangulifer]|uniref:fasciculation and elongation protein zeta-2 n=1 Tax=Neocloeon triangulifer TaxID=2078957 RepID=UPI00286FA58B|nr:fasciculation and elongation protein zeta-2 [Neocloeon triangulifer]
MREMSKMAELKFEAPLAQFESEDLEADFGEFSSNTAMSISDISCKDMTSSVSSEDSRNSNHQVSGHSFCSSASNSPVHQLSELDNTDAIRQQQQQQLLSDDDLGADATNSNTAGAAVAASTSDDLLNETFSGSLEDLVNTFDDKITKCFGNFDESVEKLAPVQVRSQEEIMNECQMWWTITGNFGNILPIDWSKTYACKMHIPALHLDEHKQDKSSPEDEILTDEEDAVASDLDMHKLILNGLQGGGCDDAEPVKTAEEVLQEIDDIIQETNGPDEYTEEEVRNKRREVLHTPLYEEKLKALNLTQLNELYMEMEELIRDYSETLIAELALRDELEYEKELKNTFISLLLAVQNRRRQHNVEKKRNTRNNSAATSSASSKNNNGIESKYLTTVIPYHLSNGPPNNQALQVLIKILKAINEDSPAVPALLTDYILKVLCPT